MTFKVCKVCENVLEICSFYKDNRSSDGHKNTCKDCLKIKRYTKKPEINSYAKEYRLKNKSIISEKNKERYKKNREVRLKQIKEWQNKNPTYMSEYHKNRYKNDIDFKIRQVLRSRLNVALKQNKHIKSCSATKDMGCNWEQFKTHIEEKFTNGMSWDNHGKWHIDHIVPLSSFDLSDKEQALKASHYTNLQPLWSQDNISKSNKIFCD